MSKIIDRINQLNLSLPAASKPAANYVSYIKTGNQIIVSGQIPFENGSLEKNIGKVGKDFSVEEGVRIAKVCALNVISQVNEASENNLDKVRCLKLGVFVNSKKSFEAHSAVANGASDLIVEVFQENGQHARSAVGVSSLPFGVAVEVDAIFEIIE